MALVLFVPQMVNGHSHFALEHKSKRIICVTTWVAERPRETALSSGQSSLPAHESLLRGNSISCQLDRAFKLMPNALGNVDQYCLLFTELTRNLSAY
jgi:hypothetical protein